MYKYRFIGDVPMVFPTVQKNGYPGELVESDVELNHPLLELVAEPEEVEEIAEVRSLRKSAVVPETNELPVSGDELKEN